ncbi:hypothetical protein MNBD_UNCLBAC01-362 [hydrothermal vent metagenome]|uniref:Hemolysin activation/secretion protein n=1 Tax=hydrothermal vent metagenome TaxID=652676 RepID=A0A3B1DMJ4_9ZZZZ
MFKNPLFIILFSFLILTHSISIYAQNQQGGITPGATTQRIDDDRNEIEKQRIIQQLKEQDPVVLENATLEPLQEKLDERKLIAIKSITVTESQILLPESITSITQDYIGKKISIKDLYAIVEQINGLYKVKGVISAKAILPPQSIKDGVIDIQLIEAKVYKINIEGNNSTRFSFIRDRIELTAQDLLDIKKLERNLIRFNSLYDVKLRTALSPGEEVGTTNIDITAQEPPKYSALTFVDNAGREEIGLYRIGGYATHRSVFGLRDAMTIGVVVSEGTRNLFTSYEIPVSTKGTKVGISFDYSNTNLVSGVLQDINVEGDFFNVSIFANHPIITGEKMTVKGLVSFNWKKSTNAFENLFTFEGKVYSLAGGVDGVLFLDKGYVYNRHMLTGSFNDFSNGDRTFLRYNGDLDWQSSWYKNVRLGVKGKLQLASDELIPSSEQFQLGGVSSIRGYPEGMLVGDNGYAFMTQISIPVEWMNKIPKVKNFRSFVFTDFGQIFILVNDAVINQNQDFIAGVGGGISYDFWKNLSGKVTLGVPIVSHPFNDKDSLRTHFYMQAKF